MSPWSKLSHLVHPRVIYLITVYNEYATTPSLLGVLCQITGRLYSKNNLYPLEQLAVSISGFLLFTFENRPLLDKVRKEVPRRKRTKPENVRVSK